MKARRRPSPKTVPEIVPEPVAAAEAPPSPVGYDAREHVRDLYEVVERKNNLIRELAKEISLLL